MLYPQLLALAKNITIIYNLLARASIYNLAIAKYN